MKKLFLTLIAVGAFLIAPSLSQAQNVASVDKQNSNATLVQLTRQLNQIAVNLNQVAGVLDVHSNKAVNAKDAKLSQEIDKLQESLKKAVQKIEKIKADRKIHSEPENDEESLEDLA